MSVSINKTVKATWTCDWCDRVVHTDSESLPPGWEDMNNGGEPCGGTHFCSTEHYVLSKNAWEDAFEASLEAQCDDYEETRLEWVQQNVA